MRSIVAKYCLRHSCETPKLQYQVVLGVSIVWFRQDPLRYTVFNDRRFLRLLGELAVQHTGISMVEKVF